jgi:signal transduction histidine kinase
VARVNLPRVPIESARPVAWFAALRVAIVAIALASLAALDVPHRDGLIVLTAAVAAPLALGVLYLAQRAPTLALSPAIALIDLAILAAAEAISPSTYGAVRFLALFLVATHAHFQGEVRGVAIALAAVILLVPMAVAGDAPVDGSLLAFYEIIFASSALSAGFFMGRLRTAESTGRLRARELSRRVIEAESQVRRRLAEAIHDGPVQELVSLDMVLDATRRALERGDPERATELLEEARAMAERNIGSLREEIVSLGPYALDELTLDVAIEQCAPVWSRRFGVPVELELADVNLPNDVCGLLFGIAQEAVANAGRHADATKVTVKVSVLDGHVELSVRDDGRGFGPGRPLGPDEPGHIGLATMRERAELAGGELFINTGEGGTTVVARAPVAGPSNGSGAG